MSVPEFVFLVAAGVGPALAGSIAVLASLISYPALLVTGVPQVAADMINTTSMSLPAVGFVVVGSVVWTAALSLAIDLIAGGRLGPGIVRRAPQTLLRRLIAAAGVALAVHLAVQAYA